MTDTGGFYKNDNGTLLYASSAVIGPEIHLIKDLKDAYEYPVMGWAWFDTEDAARIALNVPVPTPPEPPQIPGMNDIGIPPPPFPPLPTGPVNI